MADRTRLDIHTVDPPRGGGAPGWAAGVIVARRRRPRQGRRRSRPDRQGAVGGDQIANGAVGGDQIAKGAVGASHIAPIEPLHTIGASGEPQFYDGGEGDCVWKDRIEGSKGLARAGFANDALGRVWLRRVATATDGPGGDRRCDFQDPGELEDGLVFELPPGYRPEYFELSGLANRILIAPGAGGVQRRDDPARRPDRA